MIRNIEELATILKQTGNTLVPVPVSVINNLEKKIGHRLPKVYKDFLSIMGYSAGKFMLGSDAFYRDLAVIQEGAPFIVEENNFETLPQYAFVFWMHQGYRFAFFRLSDGDNPVVYYFAEDSDATTYKIYPDIIQFYQAAYDGEV